MAVSSNTVANVTVARTYLSEFSRALVPSSKGAVAFLSSWDACSVLELRYSGMNCGPTGALALLSGSVLVQASNAGRNSGSSRRSNRSASFLSPRASAFSHSTTVAALYKRSWFAYITAPSVWTRTLLALAVQFSLTSSPERCLIATPRGSDGDNRQYESLRKFQHLM